MRVDPLLLLTLVGLAAAGLLATSHPLEPLDVQAPLDQAGRHVRVHLVVHDTTQGDSWWRGHAIPIDPRTGDGGGRLSWVWFRPSGTPPAPGDTIEATAQVERTPDGAGLVMDGPAAGRITGGPRPVPVAWRELVADPPALAGRTLELNGILGDRWLESPDGTYRCPLSDPDARPPGSPITARWHVTLHQATGLPSWTCRIEGPTT